MFTYSFGNTGVSITPFYLASRFLKCEDTVDIFTFKRKFVALDGTVHITAYEDRRITGETPVETFTQSPIPSPLETGSKLFNMLKHSSPPPEPTPSTQPFEFSFTLNNVACLDLDLDRRRASPSLMVYQVLRSKVQAANLTLSEVLRENLHDVAALQQDAFADASMIVPVGAFHALDYSALKTARRECVAVPESVVDARVKDESLIEEMIRQRDGASAVKTRSKKDKSGYAPAPNAGAAARIVEVTTQVSFRAQLPYSLDSALEQQAMEQFKKETENKLGAGEAGIGNGITPRSPMSPGSGSTGRRSSIDFVTAPQRRNSAIGADTPGAEGLFVSNSVRRRGSADMTANGIQGTPDGHLDYIDWVFVACVGSLRRRSKKTREAMGGVGAANGSTGQVDRGARLTPMSRRGSVEKRGIDIENKFDDDDDDIEDDDDDDDGSLPEFRAVAVGQLNTRELLRKAQSIQRRKQQEQTDAKYSYKTALRPVAAASAAWNEVYAGEELALLITPVAPAAKKAGEEDVGSKNKKKINRD
jgi:hypothetical protein